MTSDSIEPDPERRVEQVESEGRGHQRGRLKVFFGYASGVGKTEQMFDEARRRRERGEDVVVGATQPQSSPEAKRILDELEVIPSLKADGQDVIDVSGIEKRSPQVVIVDGLAYDNPPGSRNPRRCDDVEELLAAGISVVTSINLHYIKELQDEVASITGKQVAQSVPRNFLEQADEIVVVDAPAHDEKLAALREMALLFAADVIDSRLEDYLHGHGFEETWGVQERVLVCLTPRSNATAMIDAGKRNADRFKGELYALYVRQAGLSPEDQAALDSNIAIAIERGANVNVIDSDDAIVGIMHFARKHSITQIVIGHSLRQAWLKRFKKTNVERLLESADGIDVWIFPQ